MRRDFLFAFALGLLLFPRVWITAADTDQIAARMESARRRYDKEIDQLDKSIKDAIEKKETAARKSGNKDQIESLKAELDLYDKEGVVPPSIPVSFAKKQTTSRNDLEAAYKAAIKDYTRKREDDKAKTLEEELKTFHNAPILSAIARSLIGTWHLRVSNGYTTDLIFKDDGTVLHTASGGTAPWRIDLDAGFVYLGEGTQGDRIKLPLNEEESPGFNSGGQTMTVRKEKK